MSETVLVVDDDDDVRSLHRRLLTARGYRVIEAATVAEAMERLAEHPDAIVLDLELPDGSSRTLLDKLAMEREAPPVVLCTSSAYGARVARKYHIAALGKFALTSIAGEVERVIETHVRPRLSNLGGRPSSYSRSSLA